MRILTANLFHHHVRRHSLASLLDELAPDVVAVQELCPHAAPILARRFPHGALYPRPGSAGMGLVATKPITVERVVLPYRDALVAPGEPTIWAVHLANPLGGLAEAGTRRRQVRRLLELVEDAVDDGPTVVLGDFNATPVWPAYRRLRKVLDDGVAAWAKATGRRPQPTWTIRPGWPSLLRIDHVFVAGVEVGAAQTVAVEGSDHRGILVEFA